jgi:hypothetical protein
MKPETPESKENEIQIRLRCKKDLNNERFHENRLLYVVKELSCQGTLVVTLA